MSPADGSRPPGVVDHGSGIASIRLELPFPSPRFVFCYVIEGDERLLVLDTGVDLPASWEAYSVGVRSLGHDVSDVAVVVGSHMHPDHIGMANRMLDASEADFVLHAESRTLAPLYDDWTIFREVIGRLAIRGGAAAETARRADESVTRPDWAPASPPVTRPVVDGDRIDLGGRHLEVVHTPGHDRTHICLVDSATGHMFSGDHILPRITPHVGYDPDMDALATYLTSLERFERLDPPLTYPAHVATPLDRGGARARQIRLHHERRLESIVDVVNEEPLPAWAIMQRIFRPNLSPLEQWQAFSETMSHLVLLVNRGVLEVVGGEDIDLYRRTPRTRRPAP